jgi:hypothetical protein
VLALGRSDFNHEVAALDVTEVTQSLTEGLSQAGGIMAGDQVADSGNLGRLLSLHRNRAEEPTEDKGDDEGQPDWTHLLLVSSSKPNAQAERPAEPVRSSLLLGSHSGQRHCISTRLPRRRARGSTSESSGRARARSSD